MSILRRAVVLGTVTLMGVVPAIAQEQAAERGAARPSIDRTAVEFSPVSPFIRIYAVQFARRFGDRNELLLGGAYTNIKYDHGQSHAPGGIVGYRRYLWKKAHIEYQLWPSYNWYYEEQEQRYYEGAELWNEFRPGYTFDFRVGSTAMFMNVQYLIGFGLYGEASKPPSWKDQVDEEGKVFAAPMVFLGWRF
jgi:hypothetical protein